MEPQASFLHLCQLTFTQWLLTNALGTCLVFGMHLIDASGYDAAGHTFDMTLLVGCIVACCTIPASGVALLIGLWAMSAARPAQRAGRLLAGQVAGFGLLLGLPAALATLLSGHWQLPDLQLVRLLLPYLLAALVAAGWLYRPWLRTTAPAGHLPEQGA